MRSINERLLKQSIICIPSMKWIQYNSIEPRLVLTSSHGGQHASSLFIQNKSPVFIIRPGGNTSKQVQWAVHRPSYSVVTLVLTNRMYQKMPLCMKLKLNKRYWPQTGAVSEQHVQVALQRVLVEGAAQPRATAAKLGADLTQRVEPLELVAVQVLLDVEPEGELWPCGGGGETTRVRINKLRGVRGGGEGRQRQTGNQPEWLSKKK